jgi:hypothetical protein
MVVGALLVLATGCGEASSDVSAEQPRATYDGPVVRPAAVPGAEGRVTTTSRVRVTDDGSGPWMCWGADIELGGDPQPCDAARVTGWDWDAVGEYATDQGVRHGSFVLTGTFDGTTFEVEEATQPAPPQDDWDFEIPCPTPEGGWTVLDRSRISQDDYFRGSSVAQGLDDYALAAVSTPEGEPGPRDPADTVLSVYVAGDPSRAEAEIREVWGGMLCVTQVERTETEMEAIQQSLLELPGWTQIGAGHPSNQVQLTVFHDDGRYQQWVDQEYGEDVVVVSSILQPVG